MNVWSFIVILVVNFGSCVECIFQQNIRACAYYTMLMVAILKRDPEGPRYLNTVATT